MRQYEPTVFIFTSNAGCQLPKASLPTWISRDVCRFEFRKGREREREKRERERERERKRKRKRKRDVCEDIERERKRMERVMFRRAQRGDVP